LSSAAARPLLDERELAESAASLAVPLPLDLVDPHPDNPRQHYDEIDELAQNIRQFGLMQPVIVRRVDDRYQLMGGHRRRAAYLLLRDTESWNDNWRTIPAIIFNASDERAYDMLLSAQLHTRNWRPREESAALERLKLAGLTEKQIGERLNRTESWASKRLRVYVDSVLAGYVQTMRETPDGPRPLLATTVAEELLVVRDPKERKEFADRAVAEDWSQSTARAEVRKRTIERSLLDLERKVLELLDLLSPIDASKIPLSAARNLWTLHGMIEVKGRGHEAPTTRTRRVHIPSIEDAMKKAGVKSQEPKKKPGARRKPGLSFRKR
jgi:ParB/RepB/Spo0J family partition protein